MTTIVIVGRPNVGKSTLFNRLVGSRDAIVEERPKVTRDAKEGVVSWRGREFRLVDTGGWLAGTDGLDRRVSHMVERTVETAEMVLFVVDVRTGVTEEDLAVSKMLSKASASVLVVVNKVDSATYEGAIWEFMSLGYGDPLAISAIHGRATGDLLDAIGERTGGFALTSQEENPQPLLEDEGEEIASDESTLKVAIVGRPNVGKSTLFNRIVGQERAIVFDLPGTTVDTVDTVVETQAGRVRFFDTAGMRKSSRYAEATEYYSMVRTLRAIDGADVSILVIDATVGVTGWDQRLAERIDAAGSPILIVLNKWDLVDHDSRLEIARQIKAKLSFVAGLAPLRISALSGRGVHRIIPQLADAKQAYEARIPTGELNRFLKTLQAKNPPRAGRILYGVQGVAEPPTFTLFASQPLARDYLRFLENQFRKEFDLGSTPIEFRVRKRD